MFIYIYILWSYANQLDVYIRTPERHLHIRISLNYIMKSLKTLFSRE